MKNYGDLGSQPHSLIVKYKPPLLRAEASKYFLCRRLLADSHCLLLTEMLPVSGKLLVAQIMALTLLEVRLRSCHHQNERMYGRQIGWLPPFEA